MIKLPGPAELEPIEKYWTNLKSYKISKIEHIMNFWHKSNCLMCLFIHICYIYTLCHMGQKYSTRTDQVKFMEESL